MGSIFAFIGRLFAFSIFRAIREQFGEQSRSAAVSGEVAWTPEAIESLLRAIDPCRISMGPDDDIYREPAEVVYRVCPPTEPCTVECIDDALSGGLARIREASPQVGPYKRAVARLHQAQSAAHSRWVESGRDVVRTSAST